MTAPVTHGSTDQSVEIRIIDSTDGTPEQGVEHNTSGIALWYRRRGATKTAITPAALASLDAAHSDGGIEHIDDGYYRIDVPDAAFASGVDAVMIGGEVTGMVVIGVLVPLVAAKITGDPYAVVAHSDYGNAKLVRSTTPANALSVDGSGKIATPDTQKVDINTIKGQTVTCSAGVTIHPQVGQDNKILTNASGHVSRVVVTDLATATTSVTNAVTVGMNSDKTGYGLSSGERTTLAAALEAAIINELDGTAVMQAIADLIASDMTTGDLSVQAIAAAVRDAILNRVLSGNHDTAGTPGKLLQDGATAAAVAAVKAETASILADTAELQAAWADGGRLDLILDARANQASVDVVDGIVDDIKAVTVKLNTGIEADGAVYRFTENMLEEVSVDVGDVEVEVDNEAIAEAVAPVVWAYSTRTLTTPAAQLAAGLSGTTLTILRGDTLAVAFTGLGDISTRTKLWFTAKDKPGPTADAKAAIQVEETEGLLYIAGAAVDDATKATLTVTNEATGAATLVVDADQTAMLDLIRSGSYDVQVLRADGTVQTLTSGVCHVTADTTRATE